MEQILRDRPDRLAYPLCANLSCTVVVVAVAIFAVVSIVDIFYAFGDNGDDDDLIHSIPTKLRCSGCGSVLRLYHQE